MSETPEDFNAPSTGDEESHNRSGWDDDAKSRKSRAARTFRLLVILALVVSAGGAAALYNWLSDLGVFAITPAQLQLITDYHAPDNSVVFDRDDRKIGEFFSDYHVYVPYEKLPKDMVNAIIAIEDRKFWVHHGYDLRGIVRAALVHVYRRSSEQGASTITQQVVRHFLLTNEKTMQRKVREIFLARQLEKHLSKKRILETYANAMFLGGGAYGVGAAAWRYFGRPLDKLQTHEYALIAGLFQSPSRYNPERYPKRAKARQRQVLEAMHAAGMLSKSELDADLKKPLVFKTYKPLNTQVAPYFIDYVHDQVKELLGKTAADEDLNIDTAGLRIYTTLDSRLQAMAEHAINESQGTLDAAQRHAAPVRDTAGNRHAPTIEAAQLAVDPHTGEILTMVGGRDYADSQFNRATSSLRSPGSAFKPVVYSLALERGRKWSDIIYVAPVTVDTYRPRNHEDDYLTETTMLRAFYRSMNTPAVELGAKIGIQPIIELAHRLGVRSPLKPEIGTAIGGSDVTMLDMARLYSVYANAGKLVDTVAIKRIEDRTGQVLYEAPSVAKRSSDVLPPQIAYLMTQAMRDVLIRGTAASASALAAIAAGKTGTSNGATDNWFCGYSPNLASVVWVGTDEHTPLPASAFGSTMALPIWQRFFSSAATVRHPEPFVAPSGIVSAMVNPKYGNKVTSGGVEMYFMQGQEPTDDSGAALETLEQSGGTYRNVFEQ